MKKSLFALLLILSCRVLIAQDIMTVLPDSNGREMFSDFLGVRLWAGDYKINTINQNLTFKYVSVNTGYVLQHGLNAKNINNTPNIGIGVEENLGSHLLIHFTDISVGYTQNMWNWNLGGGIGYFVALDKKRNLRLRASLDLFYEDISYGLGSYNDSTRLGIIVNGNNIGAFIRNVKYVNNILSASLGVGIMYRTNAYDYFVNAAWNTTLISDEKINFYYTRIPLSEALYNSSGSAISSGVLNLGNYIIQVGIMREFGL